MHSLPPSMTWLSAPKLEAEFHQRHASRWLAEHLPEVHCLFGVPQNPKYHPEVDTGIHVGMCLGVAEHIGASPSARLAVLLHDLGKGTTPASEWPRHVQHELNGIPLVQEVCSRIGTSQYQRHLCERVCEFHLHAHPGRISRAGSMFRFLVNAGLLNTDTPEEFIEDFFFACLCDYMGRGADSERRSRDHHDALIQVCTDIRTNGTYQALLAETQGSGRYHELLSEMHQVIEVNMPKQQA